MARRKGRQIMLAVAGLLLMLLPGCESTFSAIGRAVASIFEDGAAADPLAEDPIPVYRRRVVEQHPRFRALLAYLDAQAPALDRGARAAADGDALPRDPAVASCFRFAAGATYPGGPQRSDALQQRANAAIRETFGPEPERGVAALQALDRQGHAFSTLKLALLSLEGRVVPFGLQLSYWYVDRAARQGCVVATTALAFMHRDGLGTPPDPERAYFWFAVAAAGGGREAAREQLEVAAQLTPDQRRATEARLQAFRPGGGG